VRFAVIILAVVAMVLSPIFGPAAAHAMNGGVAATVMSGTDCDHGQHAGPVKVGAAHDHCKDGNSTCMDANGCRHLGCLTGGPVPDATAQMAPSAAPAMFEANAGRPDGLDVAPPLDPPRPRA